MHYFAFLIKLYQKQEWLIQKAVPDTFFVPVWTSGFECCARRGMTCCALAQSAQVSERHLANLEASRGKAYILLLFQFAQALNCSVVEFLEKVTTSSSKWLLIKELLAWVVIWSSYTGCMITLPRCLPKTATKRQDFAAFP